MTRKVFQLSIELDIHAITCPGVWLCPNNGKVSLCIYMFDTWRETSLIYPIFPLLIHEKFKFTKDILNAKSLADIQNALNSEHLYCELVQWSEVHRSKGIILSNFKTCLAKLLYPTDSNKKLITGVDIELLMNPCPPFPGIIAPKIEIATQTAIQEIMSKCMKKCPTYVLNPKIIRSAHCGRQEKFRRQRGVCHSDRSKQNENRLRPSSLSKLDSFRTKRHTIDSYDTKNEDNKQRYVNSIDDNNNNYFLKSPCECCKNRQISPIRQCKTKSAPKCLCDALVHNHCLVCDKYQQYFNETTTHMALVKDEKSTDDEYPLPNLSQYRYHARLLHDRVTNALNRCKQLASNSTHDTCKNLKYDPNDYTIKSDQFESKPIHSSRYCEKESIPYKYDETDFGCHKPRPYTTSAIENKKLSSNNIQRTKSESSSRVEHSTHGKLQKCKEKSLKYQNKQKDTKYNSYCHATLSSIYTTNKSKVRLQNHLEMYKPKYTNQLQTRNFNDKNKTSFRLNKCAVKHSINIKKKLTKKKKNIAKTYYLKHSKTSLQNGTITSITKPHKVKRPIYTVKSVKKCKKHVNKNITTKNNNCTDHLIIIERQSVVNLIAERIKAGEIKFSNTNHKSLNNKSSISTSISKKYSPTKLSNSFTNSNVNQQTNHQNNPPQTKHPFHKIIINTVTTKPRQSSLKEKSKNNLQCDNNTCENCVSVESMSINVQNDKPNDDIEIIKSVVDDAIHVSSLTIENLSNQVKTETTEEIVQNSSNECNDKNCKNQFPLNEMLDDLMNLFKNQKCKCCEKTESTESDEPKSEIEIIKATMGKVINDTMKMNNVIKNEENEMKWESEMNTPKSIDTSSKSLNTFGCNNKTCLNKVSLDSFIDDIIHLYKDLKGELQLEKIESDEPISEIIKTTMGKVVHDTVDNIFNNRENEMKKEIKHSKQDLNEGKSEFKIIKDSMGKVINDSLLTGNLMNMIQEKTFSKELENLKHESDVTQSEIGIIDATMHKVINEIFTSTAEKQSTSTNSDENNGHFINSLITSLDDHILKVTKKLQKGDEKSETDLDEYIKGSSIASLVKNISKMAKNLSDDKSKKDLDTYIQNSSIASLVNKISQMVKELEVSDEKSDDDLDEFIQNSSIASLVDNISQMVKQLENASENSNNLDEYIKNSSIASIVENITTHLIKKFKDSDDKLSTDIDEYIKNSSIGSIVVNITQTVQELEKIKNTKKKSNENQNTLKKENQLHKMDEIENTREISQCPPKLHYTDKIYNKKNWTDDSTSSDLFPKTTTNDPSVNEIWKTKIPSKFISSDETCIPKWSSNENNDFMLKSMTPFTNTDDSKVKCKSCLSTNGSFIRTSYYDNKTTKYSCKEIYKNAKEISSTEKSSESSKFIATINQQQRNQGVYDNINSSTTETNDIWIRPETIESNFKDVHTFSDRYKNKPLKSEEKLVHNKLSTTHPKSGSDIEMKTKSVPTYLYPIIDYTFDKTWKDVTENEAQTKTLPRETNEPSCEKWSDETLNGITTKSLTTDMTDVYDKKSNDKSIKMILTRSFATETDETIDKKSLGVGTDDSKHHLTYNHPKWSDDTKIESNSLIISTDDKKSEFITNDNIESNYCITIKKLITTLIKTTRYINKRKTLTIDRNRRRICFNNIDNVKVNDSQSSSEFVTNDNIKQKFMSNDNPEHSCYLNIEQLSAALLKTIQYISKSTKIYDSTDIEIDSDNFSNIIKSDIPPDNTDQQINEQNNFIYKNVRSPFISTNNLNIHHQHEQNVPSLLTNVECQIRPNYGQQLLPILPNQLGFDSHVNDNPYLIREPSADSEFICSKTLNSANTINQQLYEAEKKMSTFIDEQVGKYTQKQNFTRQKFFDRRNQSSEYKLNQENLKASNKYREKFTHFKSMPDNIMPDISINEEYLKKKSMNYMEENANTTKFMDDYRRKFYTNLEIFYEKLYRRAHVRAEQERQIIERNCACNYYNTFYQ